MDLPQRLAFRELVSLCLTETLDVDFDGCFPFWYYKGDHETLQFLLRKAATFKMPYPEPISFALQLASRSHQWDMANLVHVALGNMPIDTTVASARDSSGGTLLQYAAYRLLDVLDSIVPHRDFEDLAPAFDSEGNVQFVSNTTGAPFEDQLLNGHLRFIRELVRADAQLYPPHPHQTIMRPASLLQSALGLGSQSGNPYGSSRQIIARTNIALRLWLTQLQVCNVNLESYGESEHKMFRDRPLGANSNTYYPTFARHWAHTDWKVYGYERIKRTGFTRAFNVRLLNFNRGPHLDDWEVYMVEDMPSIFMEFWDMIDHPERAMPGAWVD
jgi:hypothetical protein